MFLISLKKWSKQKYYLILDKDTSNFSTNMENKLMYLLRDIYIGFYYFILIKLILITVNTITIIFVFDFLYFHKDPVFHHNIGNVAKCKSGI